METVLQNEVVFYQDTHVTVTQARFITNSKTYAIRNISSVHIFKIVKSKTIPVIMIAIGMFMLFIPDARVLGFMILVTGAAAIALMKNEFAVKISTNAGEINSIVSKDKMYVQNIVNALNDAIINQR